MPTSLPTTNQRCLMTQETILSTTRLRSRRTSCSHTRITVHPRLRSSRNVLASRFRVFSILVCHNSGSFVFHLGKRQPCQKSPSMNTATRARRNTTSGLPITVETCFRNRKPRRKIALRTSCSREVSFPLTLAMHALRWRFVRLSGIQIAQVLVNLDCMRFDEFWRKSISDH